MTSELRRIRTRSYQMNDNMNDTELVRWIVEAELASRDRVAKLYVVELIK